MTLVEEKPKMREYKPTNYSWEENNYIMAMCAKRKNGELTDTEWNYFTAEWIV